MREDFLDEARFHLQMLDAILRDADWGALAEIMELEDPGLLYRFAKGLDDVRTLLPVQGEPRKPATHNAGDDRPMDWSQIEHQVLELRRKWGEVDMMSNLSQFQVEVERRAQDLIRKGETRPEAALKTEIAQQLAHERPDLYREHMAVTRRQSMQ